MLWESTYLELPPVSGGNIVVEGISTSAVQFIGGIDRQVLEQNHQSDNLRLFDNEYGNADGTRSINRSLFAEAEEEAHGLRSLTGEEWNLISGGGWTVWAPEPLWDRDEWEDYWSHDRDNDGGDHSGGGEDPQCTCSPNYPSGFDHALDSAVDQMASQLAATIAAMPDIDKREHGAVVWRDAAGNLHATTIAAGTENETPLDGIWSQIDFAGGGQVLAILHSHPTLYNAGSAENPIWLPSTDSDTLSSGDFDHLMSAGRGGLGGYDATNYREYLVYNGALMEYYAFDQDPSKIGAGAQAIWAVKSTDTGQGDNDNCDIH